MNPGAGNTAYITSLTDSIESQLNYRFYASESANVSYQYQAKAIVRGTSGSGDSDEGISIIWAKQFTLIEPTSATTHDDTVVLNPKLTIPFASYKKMIEQFKEAFAVPLNSQVEVIYNIKITGDINGTSFNDTKETRVSIPLDQAVYKPTVRLIKSERHDVVPAQTLRFDDMVTQYEVPVALMLIAIGFVCMLYGFRKQIIKSPYQRELDRIYRYHDGIIIRLKRPANLSHKNIIAVQSFDDLLNLEEEIKTPIIASEASDHTTHFLVTRDDEVYVYTLGVQVPFIPPRTESAEPVRTEPTQPLESKHRPRPKIIS